MSSDHKVEEEPPADTDKAEDILDDDDDGLVDQDQVTKELEEESEEAIDALIAADDDEEKADGLEAGKDQVELNEQEEEDLLKDDDDDLVEEVNGKDEVKENEDTNKDEDLLKDEVTEDKDEAEVKEDDEDLLKDEVEVKEDDEDLLKDEVTEAKDEVEVKEDDEDLLKDEVEVKSDNDDEDLLKDDEVKENKDEAEVKSNNDDEDLLKDDDLTKEEDKVEKSDDVTDNNDVTPDPLNEEENSSTNGKNGNGSDAGSRTNYTDPVAQLLDTSEDREANDSSENNKDTSDDNVEMIEDDEDSKNNKKSAEVVDLSSDEEQQEEDESEEESEDDETGDPGKPPGEGAEKTVDPDHLMPFHHGWRREVVMRIKDKNSATTCDIYYIPPEDSEYRTRESKRKRRSKQDQDQYFADFPHKVLSIQHFSYVRRPLGLNNAAYEIVRKAKAVKEEGDSGKKKGKARYTEEQVNHSSDAESVSEEDEEVSAIFGFNMKMPLCLQVTSSMEGLRAESKKRRKFRDPGTACTPPLAEDMLWSALDDDPLGVHTDLGGRSSPATPPPLRAVKLTSRETAEKICRLIGEVREVAAQKPAPFKAPEVVQDNLATHDYKIRKFKNVKAQSYKAAFAKNASRGGQARGPVQRTGFRPQQQFQGHKSLLGSPGVWEKMRHLKGVSVSSTPVPKCGLHCRGVPPGVIPDLECIGCNCMFHHKCQNVSKHVRVFRCRGCQPARGKKGYADPDTGGSVKVKLPMNPVNGKRPNVELVMLQNGKYRPIKFSNNMTVTEVIPKRIFSQANSMRKTIYQRARQIPRVGNKPIYLAVNPTNPATGNALRTSPTKSPAGSGATDQVSILVRQASNVNAKPVLLNVPRKVALKVKKGTTLSFSASNDQKYVVVDNKIHPPLRNNQQPTPPNSRPIHRPANLNRMASASSSPTSIAASYQRARGRVAGAGGGGLPLPKNLSRQLPGGLSISRTSAQPSGRRIPSGNVLSSGEVLGSGGGQGGMTPCTPYCPGVTGFPELECRGCQSLFHGKCVGVSTAVIGRIQGSWMCRMCKQMSLPNQMATSTSRPVRGGGAVAPPPVIDLD